MYNSKDTERFYFHMLRILKKIFEVQIDGIPVISYEENTVIFDQPEPISESIMTISFVYGLTFVPVMD